MHLNARRLADFYESPVGQIARRMIYRRLRLITPARRPTNVLGFGFAVPYLRNLLAEAQHVVAFMPAQQGVVAWPSGRPLCVLGEELSLPFADETFDMVIMVHGLEGAESVRPLMRQIWRVMEPEGRLLLIVPNRASLWAQAERSPFAHGHPYLRGQLEMLLRESMFAPQRWESALYFPPLKTRRFIGTGAGWERVGQTLWPRLGGVHLVDSKKSLFAATPVLVSDRKSLLARA
ncbi:MAG TPA: methyltransferase domain-containing protein [Rhizomicrobium sp.]|nr:methyltransferase domain-containing protein [Rhizomicrobium sp.]